MKRLLITAFLLTIMSPWTIATTIPHEELFTSPYASMIDFSPNGKYVSMVANEKGILYFTLTNIETREKFTISSMNQQGKLLNYEWIDDTTIYSQSENGYYFSKLIFNENGALSRLKKIPYEGYVVHAFPGSRRVLFARYRSIGSGSYKLYLTSIDELLEKALNLDKELLGPNRNVSHYSYDVESKRIIASTFDAESNSLRIKYRHLNKAKWRSLVELNEADYNFKPVGFIDKSTLAVLTNKITDKVSLYEFDTKRQELKKKLYSHSQYDLISAKLIKNGNTYSPQSVSYLDHGRFVREFLVDSGREEAKLLSNLFPDMQWNFVASNDNTGLKIVRTLASNEPGAYYLYDTNNQSVDLLYQLFPQLKDYKLAKTHVQMVKLKDNVEIESYYTEATEKPHNTLLVFPHGGPVGVREYSAFNPTVQYFANRGFDILQVNFRGSEGFGKQFLEGGVGQFGKGIEQDISAAVDNLLSHKSYDHICTVGSSYGGYSSLMLAIQNPSLYNCVVAAYGVYDLPLLYNSSNFEILEARRERTVNTVGKYSDSLYEVSPVYLADKIDVPILIIGGTADGIAEFEHTQRLMYVLERHNKKFDSLVYHGVGHGHSNWKGEQHQQVSIHHFLRDSLGLATEELQISDPQDDLSIASEYSLLAAAYLFNDSVKNDINKSLKLYDKAIELGDSTAMLYLGWAYLNGKNVVKDTERGISLYKRASIAGSSEASFRLGKFYSEGREVEQNLTTSFHYYQLAAKQGHGLMAELHAAKSACLGEGTTKNLSICVNHFEKGMSAIATNSSDRKNLIADILLNGTYSKSEFEALSKVVRRFNVAIDSRLTVDVLEYGFFERLYTNRLIKKTRIIDGNEKGYFGIKFALTSLENSIDNDLHTIYYRWIKREDSGNETVFLSSFKEGKKEKWELLFSIKEDNPSDADWVLEVFDSNMAKIHIEKFRLVH